VGNVDVLPATSKRKASTCSLLDNVRRASASYPLDRSVKPMEDSRFVSSTFTFSKEYSEFDGVPREWTDDDGQAYHYDELSNISWSNERSVIQPLIYHHILNLSYGSIYAI